MAAGARARPIIVRSDGASQCQGGLDVGWRDAAVVRADRGGAPVRGGGHPHHAGICGAQMGVRAADRVYRCGRCVPLRARLPRAAAGAARTLRRRALAADAGMTMHCVAGDGVGILAGAVLSSVFGLAGLVEVVVEYILGFAFGWTIFQALFMRDMAGGSYLRALKSTFVAELLSMNLLMAGMVPTVMALKSRIPFAADLASPRFWFVMSMGLLVGFIFAYPMNWWLVAHHLKHGMMTVRPAAAAAGAHAGMDAAAHAAPTMSMGSGEAPWPPIPVMTLLSFLALAAGVAIGEARN